MIRLKNLLLEDVVNDIEFRDEVKTFEGDPPEDENGNFVTFDDAVFPSKPYDPESGAPRGTLTIGWGHTGEYAKPGNTITPAQAEELLTADITSKEQRAKQTFTEYSNFTLPVQRAIVNILFRGNLGPKTTSLIKTSPVDWNSVADEYLNSNEYRREEKKSMERRARTGTKALAVPDTNIYRRMNKNAERFRSAAPSGGRG